MKKEIADQWVKALRSGDYAQGRFKLRNTKGEFCCLGVLCDLAAKAGICEWVGPDEIAIPIVDKNNWGTNQPEPSGLSAGVQDWAGMRSVLGWRPGELALFQLNDQKQSSFADIADVIESEWESL